ncbi:hypothetical protein B0T22DRAFT_436705 [Podospora appendiculata]|uniref:NAD-dependent epimerase/dehydratase domain-containing protein n=1 Tax=Podospora appendiculata TaxID=314037 RepID=A0AAE0XID6_9PEZI|nr:hypothetical protein B0T22DRAFT_436705 [Podospora appendiculata]
MPSTLLTGANSFVGAHVIDALVKAGHHVTGTVRRAAAGDDVVTLHPEWKENFDVVVVEDITNQSLWDKLFTENSFDHVIHVAAPLLDNPAYTDYDRDFLKPNVEGNLALFRSAAQHAPALKSIVVTGSINASSSASKEELLQGPITNETWLPITPAQAREANNAFIWYCSGKKEAELALWDFVKTQSPHFTATVLLPGLIFGPPIEPVKGGPTLGLGFSSGVVYSLFNGSNATVPPTAFPSYIDARDLADAHVRALTEPKVANKRITIGGLPMTNTMLAAELRKLPELAGRVAAESGEDKNVTPADIDAREWNEALGMSFRSLEETMRDTAKRILELEGQA